MKILITKQMSQDEQVQATFDAKDVYQAQKLMAEATTLLDARLLQQSMRVVDAMKETEGLPPAVRQCINATMGVLFGRPGAMQEMAVAKEHLEKSAGEASMKKSQGEIRVVEEAPALGGAAA